MLGLGEHLFAWYTLASPPTVSTARLCRLSRHDEHQYSVTFKKRKFSNDNERGDILRIGNFIVGEQMVSLVSEGGSAGEALNEPTFTVSQTHNGGLHK